MVIVLSHHLGGGDAVPRTGFLTDGGEIIVSSYFEGLFLILVSLLSC